MLKLTVVFTVIAASILIDKVNSLESINIQDFLETLQQQLTQEQKQQRNDRQNLKHVKQVVLHPKEGEDSDNYGSLTNKYIHKIRGLPAELKKHRNSKKNQQNDQFQYYPVRDTNSMNVKIVPADLHGLDGKNDYSASSESEDGDQTKQNEYSKVYVVLNSEAIKRSKNRDKLNLFLSNLLASPTQEKSQQKRLHHHHDHLDRLDHQNHQNHHQHNRQRKLLVKADRYPDQRDSNRYRIAEDYFLTDNDWQEERRDRGQNGHSQYKGFNVQDWVRRKMHNSGEGEIERYDKKPSRPLNTGRERPRRGRERGSGRSGGGGGGGGGGSPGRTAIPYIRQHGDIYERGD